MRVPEDTQVNLFVTSADVTHNFWIPDQRAKATALPGQNTTTWFEASETGNYTARCAELCGAGHSHMLATIEVVEQDEFNQWYANSTEQ
jgi:cytochrome c oxidase subunit 2